MPAPAAAGESIATVINFFFYQLIFGPSFFDICKNFGKVVFIDAF